MRIHYAAAALLTAVCFAWPSMASAAPTEPTPSPAPTSSGQEHAPSEGLPYAGNPATEPARVADEDAWCWCPANARTTWLNWPGYRRPQ